MASRIGHLALALALLAGAHHGAAPPRSPGEPAPADKPDRLYRWFALPIRVEHLPAGAEFVPVSCALDFSAILEGLKVQGAVDPRSLRLLADGGQEVPVQFRAAPQPRAKKRSLLPGTPPAVSYVAEHPAGATGLPRVAGELTWAACAAQARAAYRLRFGVLREGTHVQVPFAARDLRGFDRDGWATPLRQFPTMQVRPQWPIGGMFHLHAAGRLVTSYHLGPTAKAEVPPFGVRRPFFYPVHGPDGDPLTDLGKPHDPTGSHAHHYSLWVAHHAVGGRDFWGEKGGIIYHKALEATEDGPVFCRVAHRAGWAFGGADLLVERRTLTLWRTPESFRLLDVEIELAPAGKEPVTLGQTTFGFLAARVTGSMSVFDGGGAIVNARGDRNERGAHLKKAAWIDQSGPVAPERWGGLALLDHPDNPNHPTTWHCRNDGWAGAAFNADGPTTLQPGKPLRLRYRLHLHRGDAATGAVAQRWQEYRAKPAVRVGKASPE
jgi:hypothetical protein